MILPKPKPGLLRHRLDDQVLVYEQSTDAVHLLDSITACVLDLLEEGGWTDEGIKIEISERMGVAPNDGFLPLAIDELRRAGMLEPENAVVALDVTRRDALRKIALGGASAMMVPAIATIIASTVNAQSPGGALACQACSPAGSAGGCAPPNTCITGTGGNRCSGGVNPTGELAGTSGSFTNPAGNCGTGSETARQTATNARCCSGSATITQCTAATISYTCN